ncbi:hypothetical protein BDV29DRAFT_173368 [Aspergillus leporis]|uniref:Uncharacterized protein n=1 Tax=Aspergillus leporis TaxID=41062 RepID=A0A5N5X1L8_9EURO|nr:hypothetical protein BDV29DRAFT_173368 [Aspergillus leporis]
MMDIPLHLKSMMTLNSARGFFDGPLPSAPVTVDFDWSISNPSLPQTRLSFPILLFLSLPLSLLSLTYTVPLRRPLGSSPLQFPASAVALDLRHPSFLFFIYTPYIIFIFIIFIIFILYSFKSIFIT